MLNSIVNQSARIYSVTPRARNIAPLFYLFMGLVFTGFGYFKGGGVSDLPFIMGCGFIVFSAYCYFYNSKAYAPKR